MTDKANHCVSYESGSNRQVAVGGRGYTRVPIWSELTLRAKVEIAALAMWQERCLAFSVHIQPCRAAGRVHRTTRWAAERNCARSESYLPEPSAPAAIPPHRSRA